MSHCATFLRPSQKSIDQPNQFPQSPALTVYTQPFKRRDSAAGLLLIGSPQRPCELIGPVDFLLAAFPRPDAGVCSVSFVLLSLCHHREPTLHLPQSAPAPPPPALTPRGRTSDKLPDRIPSSSLIVLLSSDWTELVRYSL